MNRLRNSRLFVNGPILLFSVFFPVLLLAQPSQVQSTNSSEAGQWTVSGSSFISTTPNFGSTVTLNNYIVAQVRACVNVSCGSTNPAGSLSVSDTLGLHWIACGTTTASTRESYLAIFIAKITTTGTEAVTGSCNSCGSIYYGGTYAREMSGTGLTGVSGMCDVSGESENTTVSGGAGSISTSASTNFTGEFVVSDIFTASGGCSTAPSGWTLFSPAPGGFDSTLTASTGVQTAAWTGCINNGDEVDALIAAFHDGTPPCTGSSPNLTSADWAHVQACHDNVAVNGDTITVTSGSYSVTANTTLTKYIKIVAGVGGVTLTDNMSCSGCSGAGTGMVEFHENTAGSSRISGFTINSGSANHNNPGGEITVYPVTSGKPVVVQNNTMNDSTGSENWIYYQINRGLVVGNTFNATPTGSNCFTQVQFLQSEPLGSTSDWASTVYYGSADTGGNQNLYVEGNTIHLGGITDLLSNGRVVYRYNTITNVSVSIHGVTDVNGRYLDIYNNLWVRDNTLQPSCTPASTLPQNVDSFIRIGGGVSLIHHNTIPDATDAFNTWGAKATVKFTIDMLELFQGGWPCWNTYTGIGDGHPAPEQPGWGYTGSGTITVDPGGSGLGPQQQSLEPIYVWGNTGTGMTPILVNAGLGGGQSCDTNGVMGPFPTVAQYMTEGTEYNLDVDAPSGKPGYSPYTCPHPLAGLAGSCDASTNGTTGYDVAGGNSQSFTAQPTNTASGSSFSPVVVVTLTSATADSITLSMNTGTCNLTGTTTVTSTGGGTNTATFTGLGVNGTPQPNCTLKAHDSTDGTVADVVSSSFNMTGSLSFSSQPSTTVSGATISPTITVTTSPSSTDSITLSVTTGTCTLTGTTTVSASGGLATFGGLAANATGTSCILTAHDNTNSSFADVTSGSFNITAPTMSFTQQPVTLVTGNSFLPAVQVTITAAVSDSITISVSACGTSLTGTTTVTASSGLVTFSGVGASGTGSGCVLTAHDNTNGAISDITSNSFNVNSAPPPPPTVVKGKGGSHLHRLH